MGKRPVDMQDLERVADGGESLFTNKSAVPRRFKPQTMTAKMIPVGLSEENGLKAKIKLQLRNTYNPNSS